MNYSMVGGFIFMRKRFLLIVFLIVAMFIGIAGCVSRVENILKFIIPENALVFTTIARIHPDMPEFTFHRVVGNLLNLDNLDIPEPRPVTIIIENGTGDIVQIISDLTQSNQMFLWNDSDIIFEDFNFDGYMDMRLLRWSDTGESMRMIDYVWLWDTDISQFILSEQLTRLDAADIIANQNTQQIETWIRLSFPIGFRYSYHEYRDGEFVLVSYAEHFQRFDDNSQWIYTEIIRTNVLTGEIIIEIYQAMQ